MNDTEKGYVIYKSSNVDDVSVFKTIYPSKREANAAIIKDSKETETEIDYYDMEEISIPKHTVIEPKGGYISNNTNKRLYSLCNAIESLGGSYIFNTNMDETNSFYIEFECNYDKALGIITRSINPEYNPLHFKYILEVKDFDFIKKNDKHTIYYRLYTTHEMDDGVKVLEDINTIIGNMHYWSSPAFITYFNSEI